MTARISLLHRTLCIALRLCCAALPFPHTEIPKQSCAALASSKASARAREAGRERGGGVGRAENERRCVILLKHIFPQRSFLYLFLDSKLNHSINRWAYFVMIMYSAFQPLCVVYLIFFFTRALSLSFFICTSCLQTSSTHHQPSLLLLS